MKDPISDFKFKVSHAKVGEMLAYHVGNLGMDISSSPTLTQIQMFTNGLHLMGRVGLRQKRISNGPTGAEHVVTEYSLKILHPVHPVDFDVARKTYLENLKH